MERISTLKMTRDEWREARRIGIGGSDVAAIMRLNPYRSPLDVYLDKLGELRQPEEDNEAAYWGTTLEDVVARHYAKVNAVTVKKNNHILISREYPHMIANIDRDVFSRVDGHYGYEGKTTSAWKVSDWDDDSAPVGYVLQVQHYMIITGLPFFDIACLIGGNKFVQRRIYSDPDLQEEIIKAEAEFWARVENRLPPEWDGSQSAWDVLALMYPKSQPGKVVRLPEELYGDILAYQRLDRERLDLNAQAKAMEKQRDEYKQRICAAIGDAETGILGDMEITYKTVTRKGYTTKDTEHRSFKVRERADRRDKEDAA